MMNPYIAKSLAIAISFFLGAANLLLAQSKISPFEKYPFTRWAQEGKRTQIPWKIHVNSVGLSMHQRLQAHVEVKLDGREVVKRTGRGELLVFLEIQDAAGKAFQNDSLLDLHDLKPDIDKQDITISWTAFILPGNYQVKLALYCSGTEERNFDVHPFHVNSVHEADMASEWEHLPSVEYWGTVDTPDSFFVPAVDGKLNLLAGNPGHKTDIDILVNVTNPKAEKQAVLVPILKTFSQVTVQQGHMNITTFDLVHHQENPLQENAHPLDWAKLKDIFHQTDASVINVKDLQDRDQAASFFREEVYRHVAAAAEGPQDTAHVIVIIGGPQYFINQADWKSIVLRPSANTTVYYVRFAWMVPSPKRRVMVDISHDDVPKLLSPLKLHVFTIYNPMDLHKALASILHDTAVM